jgi:hypothetical protein
MISSKVFSKAAALAASALLLSVPLAREAFAQPAAAAPTAPPADVTPEKGLKGRIFTVVHRDPDALVRILRPLGSGAHGAVISADTGSSTISARDFPENLAAIEEALKRLDVAEAPRADVELKIHVLLASNHPDASASFPEDLKEVIAALKGTLLYKSYTLVTTFVERVKDRAHVVYAKGFATLPAPDGKQAQTLQIECEARGLTIERGAAGADIVRLDNFWLTAMGFTGSASFRTDLTLRPGEKVVVGTSSVGDRGLVVVVSASVVK